MEDMCCSRNSVTSCACASVISVPSIVFLTIGATEDDGEEEEEEEDPSKTVLATVCAIAATSKSRPSVFLELNTPWLRKNANRNPAEDVYAVLTAAFFASSGNTSSIRVRSSSNAFRNASRGSDVVGVDVFIAFVNVIFILLCANVIFIAFLLPCGVDAAGARVCGAIAGARTLVVTIDIVVVVSRARRRLEARVSVGTRGARSNLDFGSW